MASCPAFRWLIRAGLSGILMLIGQLPVRADIVELESGGVIVGEWLNRGEKAPACYRIRTTGGGELQIPAERVTRVVRQKPAETEYFEIAPTYPDTVEGHWKLAQWCREHQLNGRRQDHLERILELDAGFAPAWYQLGYSQIGGKWRRQVDVNRDRGYEYHRGRWRLAQEIELVEQAAEVRAAEDQWKRQIHKLRDAANSPARIARVRAELSEIRDPHAVKALAAAYTNDRRPAFRWLMIQTIARIDSPNADNVLLQAALSDMDPEVFHFCVERLEARRPVELVDALVKSLASDRNTVVNRAAYMLGRLGDRTTITPLIEVLVTRHWLQVSPGGGAMGYSASFGRAESPTDGTPGTGLSKSEPQWIEIQVQNQDVLDALVKLSGGANFSYSIQGWRVWNAARKQRPAPAIDSRRELTQTRAMP